VILFESPQRVAETLRELAAAAPEREVALCRELTKMHEEILRGSLGELSALERDWLGEITLVLGAEPERDDDETAPDPALIDAEIASRLQKGAHPKDLATELAARLKIPRRSAYARVLAVRAAM
jgi:16S rRNA (cytidine1402-2'-O)-methyltransferase